MCKYVMMTSSEIELVVFVSSFFLSSTEIELAVPACPDKQEKKRPGFGGVVKTETFCDTFFGR